MKHNKPIPQKLSNTVKYPDAPQDIVVGTTKRTVQVLEGTPISHQGIDKKSGIHYEFPILSSSSRLSITEKKLIQDCLGKDAIKARVYCIRHGMSIEEKEGKKLQTDAAPLCDEAKEQYQTIADNLQRSGANRGNTYLLYCEGTREGKVTRIIESAELLAQELRIPPERIMRDIAGLDTTDKEDGIDTRRKLRTAYDTSHFAAELQSAISGDIENINIICIVHKSNIAAMEETLFGQGEYSITLDAREMKPGDIVAHDFDKNGRSINYRVSRNILQFNTNNSHELIEILTQETGLKEIIKKFKKGEIQRWELQNYINAYFVANKKLYEKYLNSENMEMRVYCLANLLKEKNYPPINEYYLSENCTSLPIGEKLLLIESCNNHSEIKHLIQKLFILRPEFWKDEDQVYIEKSLGVDFYRHIKRNRETYEMATELQGFSLDEMIQEHQEGSILSRDVFYWQKQQKKTREDGKSPEEEKVRVSTNFEQIIQSGGNYILRAHVGQGKSFWITELTKHASLREREVFFYKAKDLGMRSEKQVTDLFASIPEGAILCIDAIDEIHSEKKEGIKKLIASYRGTCIITARESEYPEDTAGYTTLSLVPMDAEEFLESRFQNEREKLVQVREILKHNHLDSEVIGNPLLLTLVTLLAKMNDEDIEKYARLGIKRLKDIQNKADLYESVVRFILTKHAKETKGQDYDPEIDLTRWMDELGEYAYTFHSGHGESKQKPYYDQNLSILFRNLGTNQYEFVHYSFHEYFLARHLAHTPDGEDELYKVRDTNFEDWNNWRNFRPVILYYGEMLANSGDIDGLERLLGENGLLKNDDIFGEGLFMGLEILYTLPEEIQGYPRVQRIIKSYEETVEAWDLHEVIKRLEPIKKLTKAVGNIDTTITDKTLEQVGGLGIAKLLEITDGIVAPRIIKIYEGYIKNKKTNKIGSDLFLEICRLLTLHKNEEGIQGAIKCAEVLMKEKRFREVVGIYQYLVESGNEEWIQGAIKSAKSFMEGGELQKAGYLYVSLVKFGNEEGIQGAITCIDALMKEKRFLEVVEIYPYLVESGNEEWIQGAIKCAEVLMKEKRFLLAGALYRSLVKFGNEEGIQGAITCIDALMEGEEFEVVGFIAIHLYQYLVESGNEEWIQGAIKCAEVLMKKKRFLEVVDIYQYLVKFGNEEGIQGAIKCAEVLMKKKRFLEVIRIYQYLVESGNEEGIQGAIKYTEVLMKEEGFLWAGVLYSSLVESGNEEWIQGAIKCAEVLMKEKRFLEVVGIYPYLVESGNEEGIQGAIKCAEVLMKKRKSSLELVHLYQYLVESGNEEGIQGAIKYTEVLMKKKRFREVVRIYQYIQNLSKRIPPTP